MDTISFDKLLLKTGFCCMASDGHIDSREVIIIKALCENSSLFAGFDFESEINQLVTRINIGASAFIEKYFSFLEKASLTEEEELLLIDFAISTIKADEDVQYSEIKFFKNIRHRLAISDERILEKYPDIEIFLEDDIVNESYIKKITEQFVNDSVIPQFEFINLEIKSQQNE